MTEAREQVKNRVPGFPRVPRVCSRSVLFWAARRSSACTPEVNDSSELLERAKGFEPSTPTLAKSPDGLRQSLFFYPINRQVPIP